MSCYNKFKVLSTCLDYANNGTLTIVLQDIPHEIKNGDYIKFRIVQDLEPTNVFKDVKILVNGVTFDLFRFDNVKQDQICTRECYTTRVGTESEILTIIHEIPASQYTFPTINPCCGSSEAIKK